jgi:hypothetical protein
MSSRRRRMKVLVRAFSRANMRLLNSPFSTAYLSPCRGCRARKSNRGMEARDCFSFIVMRNSPLESMDRCDYFVFCIYYRKIIHSTYIWN